MKYTRKSINYKPLYAALDALLAFSVLMVAFLSYYKPANFVEEYHWLSSLIYSGSIAIVTPLVFWIAKIYKIITKDIGIFECLRIMFSVLAIQLVGLIVISFVSYLPRFTDYIFAWLLSTASLVFLHPSIRVLVRVFNIASIVSSKTERVKTIVIGAGATGKVVIDETRRNKNNHNLIVAVVDDDPNKIGGLFANIPVKGPISDIAKIIDYTGAQEVIIAMSKISQERLHEIVSLLNSCNVRVRRMPLIEEMEGPNDKRIIDVDLDDLLSRDPVVLDNEATYEMLNGKVVMVTGAGGSIGSELVRQIFNTHPSTLILFDIYENSTYEIQMELTRRIREEKIKDIQLVTLIGSTYNETRVEQIIKKYRPNYIYHAAAYKHVPLMEDSPAEAIRTNVIGTYNVAKMADKYNVQKMVLVSTDKAVRPTNVMGATKRFAETIIQYFDSVSKNTKYAAVRFGNVLGSNGSVVPLFKKQIEMGGPITLTDKQIIRYFMTIPEAVSLILQCGLFAKGGEIFILDMGKPVKILDLAEKLIRQAGLVPYVDIDIVETGLRPGEKLFEELLLDTEHQKKTENNRIYIEEKESVNKNLESDIKESSKAFDMDETTDIKKLLASLIKTYTIDKKE
ncbi:MAG: polysaccharide biosynthesis protein [Clostridia bacterium]|nr:polysaccharide biosynthesis protein [Clostridia bacterium]